MIGIALCLMLDLEYLECVERDLCRFPSQAFTNAMCAAYDERIAYAESMRTKAHLRYQSTYWWEVRCQLGEEREPWLQLSVAYAVKDPRERLTKLREIIGEKAYAAGQMPMPE